MEDGTILGESTVGHYGYLTTEKTYSNFVLRVKFKPETDGNSGVFTRSRITGNSPQDRPGYRRHAGGSGPDSQHGLDL